jgi:cytidylate kinase
MPIITVSRGSYSRGQEVAEKVAQKLGYQCISREVLVEASEEFHVPEVKLIHAIKDPPSFLEKFSFGRERYTAFIQAALLDHFKEDHVVYHGLAGHFFVRSVSHVLKVRILAEMDDRAKLVMERDGISEEKALDVLRTIDESRRKWALHLYGIDTNDPSLYDLVIHIKKLSTDDAAEMICHAARLEHFQATTESQNALDNLALAARVKAGIIDHHPRVNVTAHEGSVFISLEGATPHDEKEITDAVEIVPGVKKVNFKAYPFITPD